MLMLNRLIGQTIMVEDHALTLTAINATNIELSVDGKRHFIPLEGSKLILPNVTVLLSRVTPYEVRLGIKAPESIKILREELYKQERAA